jgi:integrase
LASNRHKSKWPGIYYELKKDGSKSWIATWKEPVFDLANPFSNGRRTVELRFGTPEEARAEKLQRELVAKEMRLDQFAMRDPADVISDNVTVRRWVEAIESTKRRRSLDTAKRDEGLLRNHVYPALGSLRLGKLNRHQHVEPWVTDLSSKLAPSTVRKVVQLLSGAMEAAIDEGLLARNPSRGVQLPPEPDKEIQVLSVDEIHALADVIDPGFRAMVYVGGFAGLRVGEVAGLTVPKVDLSEGSLRVDYTLTADGELKEPKTKASRRTVALSPFLVEELSAHVATFPPGKADLIFTMPEGRAIHMTNWRSRYWQPACDRALGRRVRFHTLRHSHTVQLQQSRVDPKVIMARLGHNSLAVSYDIYAHSTADDDRLAAYELDHLIRLAT